MKIAKQYVSEVAERLVRTNELAAQAFHEVCSSILNNVITSHLALIILF